MIKNNINTLRAWAILGVITIHVSMNFTKFTELSWLPVTLATIDIYAHFAVPLFVTISGFLLAMKYDGNYRIGAFYKKRINRIFYPFIIWSIIYLLLDPSNFSDPVQVVLKIITGSAYYHLWFFFLIIQLYLIFPFLRKFLKNKNITIVIMILAIQVIFRQYKTGLFDSEDLSLIFENLFFTYIFFFSLGIWINDNINKVEKSFSKITTSKNILIFSISILISFAFSYNWLAVHNSFFEEIPIFGLLEMILLPLTFITIFVNLLTLSISIKSGNLKELLFLLSKYSFGIYLSHALILRIAVFILKKIGITWQNAACYPSAFIITIIESLVFCYIVERTPLSKPLLSIDRHRRIT